MPNVSQCQKSHHKDISDTLPFVLEKHSDYIQ